MLRRKPGFAPIDLFVTTAIIATSLIAALPCAAQGNRLTNPGFEDGVEGWGAATADAIVDVARSGDSALRVVCPTDQRHASVGQTVSCQHGQRYRVSIWSKGTAGVSVLVWYRDEHGKDVPPVERARAYVSRRGPIGLHDWSQTALIVEPPERCTRLKITLYARAGEAIFDDCAVIATDSFENLLLNGGMEVRTVPDTPDGWHRVLRGNKADRAPSVHGPGRWSAVQEQPYEGEWCIRNDTPNSDIRSVIGDCPPGTTLTFSVYLRAEPPMQVGGYIWAGEQAYEQSLTTWRVDEQWRRYSTTVTVPPKASQARVTIKHLPVEGALWADAAQLEVGERATELRASLRDLPVMPVTAASQARLEIPATFASEAPPAPAAAKGIAIDTTRECLLVDGQPFFGVGMGGVPVSHLRRMVEANCNMVMPYEPFGEGDDELDVETSVAHARQVLDRAEELGLKVILWMGLMHDGEYKQWYADEERRTWLDRVIRALADHRALLAWKTVDEPHTVPSEWIERLYEFFRKRDPDHPAFINLGAGRTTEGCITNYGPFSDLVSVDYYPAARAASLERIAHYAHLLRRIQPEKPLHYWLQYFCGAYWRRLPTPAEETAMAYLSVIHGTSLITWFTYRPASHLLWGHVSNLNAELRKLAEGHGLLTPPPPGDETLIVKDGIHALVKPGADRLLLVTVNAKDRPAQVRWDVPDMPAGIEVRVLFEDRTIKPTNGGFDDRFEALQRHVYVIE